MVLIAGAALPDPFFLLLSAVVLPIQALLLSATVDASHWRGALWSVVSCLLQAAELPVQVRRCFRRLQSVLVAGVALPGCGVYELACSLQLKRLEAEQQVQQTELHAQHALQTRYHTQHTQQTDRYTQYTQQTEQHAQLAQPMQVEQESPHGRQAGGLRTEPGLGAEPALGAEPPQGAPPAWVRLNVRLLSERPSFQAAAVRAASKAFKDLASIALQSGGCGCVGAALSAMVWCGVVWCGVVMCGSMAVQAALVAFKNLVCVVFAEQWIWVPE